jgi:NAD(P)-dependent dehydrogenase (short-subunit alcohol dehydrogenase family)
LTFTIDLSGRRALVTGAGQGIGRHIAATLGQAGADVIVNDLLEDRAGAVASELNSAGINASGLVFDVTDWQTVAAAVEEIGEFDILVNNAGNRGTETFELRSVADSEPADWEPFLRVNLYGVMYCTRAALPALIRSGRGRVITIISDSARVGNSYMAPYAAAKAGAAGFCRSLATEVGRFGVTANCLSLGTMRTPMTGLDLEFEDPVKIQSLLRDYAIRRRGEPEDLAGLVALLASDHGSWITGQTIPVNGGHSMAL